MIIYIVPIYSLFCLLVGLSWYEKPNSSNPISLLTNNPDISSLVGIYGKRLINQDNNLVCLEVRL
jgi:hypothetical protein